MELRYLPTPNKDHQSESGMASRKLEGLIPYHPRPYSSLEVELTTRCNLFCPSCPRAVFRDSWLERDMSLERFEKISRYFDQFETIHFCGWGEPVLNPYFPEMVRRAYQSGARLVLTTNGVTLPRLSVLDYFDAVFFRLDHGRASVYERRNPSARFNRVIFNISQVLHHRDARENQGPVVTILFAKHKFSLRDLPSYLETAGRLRPDRVVFYQPVFHVRPADDQAHLPADVDPEAIRLVDKRLADMADSLGLDVVNPSVEDLMEKRWLCGFDPSRSVYLNWQGRVSLCRNSALPVVGGGFGRFFKGRPEALKTALFGSLADEELEQVLGSRAFVEFRRACLSRDWKRIKAGYESGDYETEAEEPQTPDNVIQLASPPDCGFCNPQ